MTESTKEKFELIKSMNTIVKSLNDESAYYKHWIQIVPDEADDDDLLFMAEDNELLIETVLCFKYIMKNYLKYGIFIDDNLI